MQKKYSIVITVLAVIMLFGLFLLPEPIVLKALRKGYELHEAYPITLVDISIEWSQYCVINYVEEPISVMFSFLYPEGNDSLMRDLSNQYTTYLQHREALILKIVAFFFERWILISLTIEKVLWLVPVMLYEVFLIRHLRAVRFCPIRPNRYRFGKVVVTVSSFALIALLMTPFVMGPLVLQMLLLTWFCAVVMCCVHYHR